jgi:hypothetical protein
MLLDTQVLVVISNATFVLEIVPFAQQLPLIA